MKNRKINIKKCLLLIFLSFLVIVIFGTLFINLYMVNYTSGNIIEENEVKKITDIDAILVLGCKAYSYGPSLMLSYRLEKGIDIYNQTYNKIILSGDHGKNDYDEVNVMRDYMLDSDIPSQDIFLDHAGFSTYDSIYRAKYIFGTKKIIIITQKYHLYRALYIAKKIGIEAYGIPASDIPQKGIMLKNEIREILSRDKNFIKVIFKPQSKYLGEKISLEEDGNVTNG